ncbi:DUF4412 domain-containing protein [SCandidatus Aminicenantes bacterium Aminicenantia_JdfR_composite]|nr:DUF4412 domain-containing protein [SCandidatus Aminicenantes bacterium Aminicenantia_JdfR_composite]MCP2620764.1 DUF4412 domain-containing protein [Candidatus Aminicenantes bacterium AC-334-E05]
MKGKIILSTILVSVMSLSVFAGWFIQESYREEDQPKRRLFYIQNNRFKVVEKDFTSIVDVEKGILYFVNNSKKVYWKGTPAELKKEIDNFKNAMMKEMMKNLPPEQREAMKKEFEKKSPIPKVKIVKTSEKSVIANYPAVKYKVFANNELKEEIWLSSKIKIGKEINTKKFASLMKDMNKATEGTGSYEANLEYQSLIFTGFPLKTVEYTEYGIRSSEATLVEQKNFSSSEFEIPASYKEVSLAEFFKGR